MAEQIISFSKRIYSRSSLDQAKDSLGEQCQCIIQENQDNYQFIVSNSDSETLLEELKTKTLLYTILNSGNE